MLGGTLRVKGVCINTVAESIMKYRLIAGCSSAFVKGKMDVVRLYLGSVAAVSVASFLGGCQGRAGGK